MVLEGQASHFWLASLYQGVYWGHLAQINYFWFQKGVSGGQRAEVPVPVVGAAGLVPGETGWLGVIGWEEVDSHFFVLTL